MKRIPLLIEFSESAVHLLDGERGLDLPLDRDASGQISAAAAGPLAASVREFFTHSPRLDAHGYCAIPARGVSLRRIAIPASAKENARSLLLLQLEAQLPVPPSELAWGCVALGPARVQNGGDPMQEYLVAAIRKSFLEPYARILSQAGLEAEFTPAALNRAALCDASASRWCLLDKNGAKAELICGDERGPLTLKVLGTGEISGVLKGAAFVSGPEAGSLAQTLGAQAVTPAAAAPGQSAANLGLQRCIARGETPMVLGGSAAPAAAVKKTERWTWAVAAALLLLVSLGLRYAEAGLYRARISKKLAELARRRETLPKIDREVAFLNYIKTNQPPYLEAVAAVAAAAPPGTRIDSLALVRRGELSLRGSIHDLQGPGHLRTKLIDSGFFTRVVIEEQTPVENNQKVNFRMSALVKPEDERKPLVLETHPSAPAPPKPESHRPVSKQLTGN